jgi:hypothetical protein
MASLGEMEVNLHILAIEDGKRRVEFQPIDLTVAYAALSPLVTEARAHLLHGDAVQAGKSLDAAKKVIETASAFMYFLEVEKGIEIDGETEFKSSER